MLTTFPEQPTATVVSKIPKSFIAAQAFRYQAIQHTPGKTGL